MDKEGQDGKYPLGLTTEGRIDMVGAQGAFNDTIANIGGFRRAIKDSYLSADYRNRYDIWSKDFHTLFMVGNESVEDPSSGYLAQMVMMLRRWERMSRTRCDSLKTELYNVKSYQSFRETPSYYAQALMINAECLSSELVLQVWKYNWYARVANELNSTCQAMTNNLKVP